MKKTKTNTVTVFIANEDYRMKNGSLPLINQCGNVQLHLYAKYTNGTALLEECKKQKPDVIVSDIFLDELDLLTIIKKFAEDHYAPIVVAIGPKNPIFVNMAMNNGCSYYISGSTHIDSITYTVGLLLNTEAEREETFPEVVSTEDYIASIVEDKLVNDFGVPYSILGFLHLKDAITYVIAEGESNIMNIGITKILYPYIAKKYNTTASRVERNIRTAVDKACSNCGISIMEKYFGKSCNEFDENPTNSQFICTVARRIISQYNLKVD